MIQMVMANFLASRREYRNAFTVPRLEGGIAVHVYYLQTKMKPRLRFPQGGDHVLAKMAVLPPIDHECGDIVAFRAICCPCHSASS